MAISEHRSQCEMLCTIAHTTRQQLIAASTYTIMHGYFRMRSTQTNEHQVKNAAARIELFHSIQQQSDQIKCAHRICAACEFVDLPEIVVSLIVRRKQCGQCFLFASTTAAGSYHVCDM